MPNKDTTPEVTEITLLARLMFVADSEPLPGAGDEELEGAREKRRETWLSEKQQYMARARRLHRVMASNDDIELRFKASSSAKTK